MGYGKGGREGEGSEGKGRGGDGRERVAIDGGARI